MRNILYVKGPLLLLLVFISSCTGYRFRSSDNPFREYDIKTIGIPVFLNRSIYPHLNNLLTKEVRKMLGQYSHLKIVFGDGRQADGVLVGILTSAARHKDAFKTKATTFTTGDLKASIGERNQFFVSTGTEYRFSVQLALIKNPTEEEINALQSQFGPFLAGHPKILFNERIDMSGSFSHIIAGNEGADPDRGGVVNATKNKAIFERNMAQVAKSFAVNFKEVIINAF